MSFFEINTQLFKLINDFALRYTWLDWLGIFLAKYLAPIFIGFLLLWVLFQKRGRLKFIFSLALAALIGRGIVTELIRFLYYVDRPFVSHEVNQLLPYEPTASFPSGHAVFYFALAGVVYLKSKKTGLIFLLFASLISLARVFIGVHWPADIVAGAIVGLLAAWLVKIHLKP